MIIYSIIYSGWLLAVTGHTHGSIVSYYLSIPLYALLPPLFYAYLKYLLSENDTFIKKDLWHYLPAFFFLVVNIVLLPFIATHKYLIIVENKMPEVSGIAITAYYYIFTYLFIPFLLLQPFIYLWFSIRLLVKYKKNRMEEFSFQEGIDMKWVLFVFIVFSVTFLFNLITGNAYKAGSDISARIIYFSNLLIVNLMIGVFGVRQEDIYYSDKNKKTISAKTDDKYKTSTLSAEKKKEIYEKLLLFITNEKLYLKNDLRLDQLAKKMNTNRQYLSQIINEESGSNFYHLVNHYRIEEFIRLSRMPEHKYYNIEGLGNLVGFKSKSSLYAAFKRLKNKFPSDYINS